MSPFLRLVAVSAAVLASGLLSATAVRAEALPIERVFAAPSLTGRVAQGVKLSPDGRLVGYLEAARDDPQATLLWVRPVAGGAPRVLADSRSLGAAKAGLSEERMKVLERRHETTGAALDYWWSGGGDKVLVSYAGALNLIAVAGGQSTPVVKPGAARADPQLSPGDRWVSFVRDHKLVLHEVATGAEHALGPGAGETITYGEPNFIDQEEIQRFTGAWWSPDGRRIAYTRSDETAVTRVNRMRVDATGLEVVSDRFALTGSANAEERIFIREAPLGPPVEVDLGPTLDIYILDCAWAKDGRTFYVQRLSRDQHRLDLLAVDPSTGRSRVLLTETSRAWVDPERDFRPLKDGRFLWGSARTGNQHLYLYDRDGRLVRPVTSGSWRVANPTAAAAPDFSPIVGVDEAKGVVYFVAGKDTPVERQLYAVSYAHADTPRALTVGHGWWTPSMARDAPTAFVGAYSDPTTPPQTALYDLSGKRLAWIAENRIDPGHPCFPYLDHRPTYEYGTLKAADGEDLHYLVAKPAGFDPARRYPAIVRVYGGPNVQFVRREWRPLSDQIYAQNGYVIFALDNRGSANRSDAFERAIHGRLGGASTEDQIAGIAYLRSLPYIDPDRIGMTGWSFGAYETVRTMMTPDTGVRAGVAGGTPTDFRRYDTFYTERFLGKPQDNAAAYAEAGILGRAAGLHGDLLLMHGMSDDNVSLSNFTALVTELERLGKPFEMDLFPGQSHAIRGPAAQTRQLKDAVRFFNRALAPRPPP